MVKHQEMYLGVPTSKIIRILTTQSVDQCLVECVLTTNCSSVNYMQTELTELNETMEGKCYLLRTDRFRDVDLFTTQAAIRSIYQLPISVAHFSIQVNLAAN